MDTYYTSEENIRVSKEDIYYSTLGEANKTASVSGKLITYYILGHYFQEIRRPHCSESLEKVPPKSEQKYTVAKYAATALVFLLIGLLSGFMLCKLQPKAQPGEL